MIASKKTPRIFLLLPGKELGLSSSPVSVGLDESLSLKRVERAHSSPQHLPSCWPGERGRCHLTLLSWLVPCLTANFLSGLPGSSFKELKIASQFLSLRSFLTLDKPGGQIDLTSVASCLSALIKYSLCRASCQESWKIIEEGRDALLAFARLYQLTGETEPAQCKIHGSANVSQTLTYRSLFTILINIAWGRLFIYT